MRRSRSPRGPVVLMVAAAVALAAGVPGGGSDGKERPRLPERGQRAPTQRVSFLARIVPPPRERPRPGGPRVPRSIADLARRLPLERKVSELFLRGFQGQDLRHVDLGGIVFERQNYLNSERLAQMAGEALVLSQREKHVLPWVMAPQDGGEFNVFPDLPGRTIPWT